MPTIKVTFRDEVYLRLEIIAESEKRRLEVRRQIEKYFSFDTSQAEILRHLEFAKSDGTYRLYFEDGKRLYVGLFPHLMRFAKKRGYKIDKHRHLKGKDGKLIPDDFFVVDAPDYNIGSPVNEEQFREWLEGLELPSEFPKMQEHETTAMLNVLRKNRAIMLIRPEEDKHPVLYCLLQWLMKEDKKCLFVVWNKEAVERLYKRFKMSDHIQKLYDGLPKEVSKPILMAGWQSVYRQPEEWFDRFDAVIVDEANKFRPKSLISMMERMKRTRYRIGIIDWIENLKIDQLVFEGLFGSIEKVWEDGKPREYQSGLNVTCLHLNYPNEIKERRRNNKREDEIKFLERQDKRNNFISNLACDRKGNTLVLIKKIDHRKVLYDMIREKVEKEETGKKVFMNEVPSNEDKGEWIVLATFQNVHYNFHVGNLDNIILSISYKTEIRSLRSIGSDLESRNATCDLYDIVDDLSLENWKNHLIRDAKKRMKVYKEEKKQGLSVRIVRVMIK